MLSRPHQRGFTLIELMVGVSIVALLMLIGLPDLRSWMQNMQIRNSAESILNGLQLAKAQAVKSNVNVEFILTTASPTVGNVGASSSTTGTNWIVRTYQSTGTYAAGDFIQGRVGTEGSRNATVTATQASFIFTPLARLWNPPAADQNINVTANTTYNNRRPMRIIVSPGGQIRMCDPNGAAATSPQFC